MICLKEHIWGVICCILTPDGRFRLTTKPTLAWSDAISLCHSPPLSTHRKQNTSLHSQPAVLVSVPLGCFIASLLFIDKAGFPWQPLKQVPSVAHTFSKVCFVEAEVWCLKVTDACHDRLGFSWVAAVVCSAWGPLSQRSCGEAVVGAPLDTFTHREDNSWANWGPPPLSCSSFYLKECHPHSLRT